MYEAPQNQDPLQTLISNCFGSNFGRLWVDFGSFSTICSHIYTRTYTHIHAYTCIYTHIHAYTRTYTHIHAYTRIYMRIHAYTLEIQLKRKGVSKLSPRAFQLNLSCHFQLNHCKTQGIYENTSFYKHSYGQGGVCDPPPHCHPPSRNPPATYINIFR